MHCFQSPWNHLIILHVEFKSAPSLRRSEPATSALFLVDFRFEQMDQEARKPLWLRITLGLAWVSIAAGCLATGLFQGWAGRSQILPSLIKIQLTNEPPETTFKSNSINLLILGCDEDRYYAGAGHKQPGAVLRHASRSDMMLVAKVDFANKRISAISIPRDLAWSVPGYKTQKINAFHAIGFTEGGPEKGKELARRAAEGVTGVTIDRVVVLNFEAFKSMIDMLGGIEVYVPRNMDYDDNAGDLHIHLKKGRQVLTGYNAMCYVRYRHGDSDFKRQERQKDLMMSLKDRALQQWQKTPEVVDKSIDLLGRTFTPVEIAALALFGRKVGGDNFKMDMVPVIEIPGTSNLQIDNVLLAKKLKALHLDSSGPISLR